MRRERYRRLLVPFLVGVLLVSPPQAYVEAITQRGFDGTFAAYLPHFFGSLEHFSWHHLWFLIYLFTFTLLYLPLFVRLDARGVRATATHLYLAVVPCAAVQLALRWRWPGFQNLYDDWANFAWYSLFFVGGFLLARVPNAEDVVRRERGRATIVFAVAIVAMLPLLATLRERVASPGPGYVAYWTLAAVAGVSGVAALFGHAARLEARGGRSFSYLREAALPVYVLHQSVIVVLGYWIVNAAFPVGVRYLALLGASVTLTLALYEVVRLLSPLRVAFGLRLRTAG